MGCRIKRIKPPCNYAVDGIDKIYVLDFEDFNGFMFDGDKLYSKCLVTAVLHSGEFIEIDAPDHAKYNSNTQNGLYSHTLETYIRGLSSNLIADLHLATKRRHIVFYRSKLGAYFCFGYEAGASCSFTGQTSDGVGFILTLSANSIYPIFEIKEGAFNPNVLGEAPDTALARETKELIKT